MRVLMTSILCQSGLMTHVLDLIKYCQQNSVAVSAAFLKTDFASPEQAHAIKQRLGDTDIWEYEDDAELMQIAEAARCDLIHAHSYLTFNAARSASERLEIPLVVTLHSVYLWAPFYWSVLAGANRIIAVGPAQARFVGPWKDKTVIIPNGIDTTVFTPGDELADNPITVLWYGRVDGRLNRGLVALDQLAPGLPQHIRIAGLGQADVSVQNMPFTGWTDDPIKQLQASHITFAHGRSLREAMACGSVGMLVGHGYGGRVTRERLLNPNYAVDALPQYHLPRPRPEVLLRDILEIAESGELPTLRREAREIAQEFFSLELMGRRTLAVYSAATA
jgi:glycosyltransferase involved in cell wall biosynthesis